MRSSLLLLRAAVRMTVASPRTAWLMVQMLAWKAALSLLKHIVGLPKLVGFVEPQPPPALDRRERGRVEYAVRRLGRVLGGGDCLERSLVTYRFLVRAGARPRLIIGFDRENGRVAGHAWVTVDDEPVVESREALARYVAVAAFSPPAEPRSSPSASAG
jgi:hypothetical protein